MTCKHALILNIRRYLLASVQCVVRSYIVHPDVSSDDLIIYVSSCIVCSLFESRYLIKVHCDLKIFLHLVKYSYFIIHT